jgi:NAD+ diphosphatase
MRATFLSAVDPPTEPSGAAWGFTFREDRLLVLEEGERTHVPSLRDLDERGLVVARRHYLGLLENQQCYAVELALAEVSLPSGMALHGLRSLYGRLAEDHFALAGRAVQILTWDRTHQFCGQCGTATELMAGERGKRCPACSHTAYPRLSPAVIMLITRPGQVLLARGRQFPEDMYSTPAGFVEPGESLEEAVQREIAEEVGVSVRDIRYFGSQPWPFPHQMMIGFTATWDAGEIRIDENELADAQWFTRDAMPRIPPRMSISRALIDAFLSGERGS